MKKVIATMLLAAASAMAISASRIGPVSTYGELKANGGKLSGSCPDYANKAVQVRGMSLFWSNGADSSTVFYSEKAINAMVKQMNIEVIRFAMGVTEEKFKDQGRGYRSTNDGKVSAGATGEALQKGYLKNVVNAAIDNDIYVIIDWHIESANGNTSDAASFFEYAAKEYGSYNNVIFEVWNEPNGADMGTVASHANTVIQSIRKHSDNLVLVGSPEWSSHPEQCASAGINDKNYACTLHFYAATGDHQVKDNGGGYNGRASEAIGKGVPVFASEWGTVSANGDGSINESASNAWVDWMAQNNVSWANWSASAINEKSAAFKNLAIDNGLSLTTSGEMVNKWMNGTSGYKDCHLPNGNASSSDGFSAGVANGASTDLIDDLEDGDHYGYTGGWWSGFADSDDDKDGKGGTTITNKMWTTDAGKETYDVLMASDGGKNTSKYMAGIQGIKLKQGGYKYAPYVAIGLNLSKEADTYTTDKGDVVDATKPVDLSACKSISYKFKGASHNFRVETEKVINWNFHNVNKDASEDWKEVELTWDQFIQASWGDDDKHFSLDKGMGAVRGFAWQVIGALDVRDEENQPKYDYLYIDDVRCNGVSIKAITSGTAPVATSSASVNPGSSASTTNPASSAVAPVSSASFDPNLTIVDIDDVEDGDEVLKTTGTWYAYTDKDAGGLSTFSNVYDETLGGYVVVFPGSEDPSNGTQNFIGVKDIKVSAGTYKEAPFVAIGLNTMADTSLGIDLSGCAAISYRYKGSAHTFKIKDGQVQDYDDFMAKQDSSTTWKTVVLEKKDISQMGWGEYVEINYASIKKMAWEVLGWKGSDAQPYVDYLYIDDLKCVGQSTAIKGIRTAMSGIKFSVQGGMLNLSLNKGGFVKVQIFDMMGHVVTSRSENMTAGMHQVSLENMSQGNYVVRIMNGSDSKMARISIK